MQIRLAKGEFSGNCGLAVKQKRLVESCSLHGHDFFELEIVLGGSAQTELNQAQHALQAGDVLFLTPEDFHNYKDCRTLELYNVQFAQEAVALDVLVALTSSKSRIYRPDGESFSRIVHFAQLLEEGFADPAVATRLLECILLSLGKSASSPNTAGHGEGGMQGALAYIHAHFKENPSLGEVAALLHINERYFCKRFKEYTGQTYKEYLRGMKLRYAKRLILASEKPIIDVAAESGYGSQSHFNREFRQFFGERPLDLRRPLGDQ